MFDYLQPVTGLMIFGAALFSIAQYFDQCFDSELKEYKKLIEDGYSIPLENGPKHILRLGARWGKLLRWEKPLERWDISCLIVLLLAYPIFISAYFVSKVKVVDWFVSVGNTANRYYYHVVLFYAVLMFIVACYTYFRLLLQTFSLRAFRREVVEFLELYRG